MMSLSNKAIASWIVFGAFWAMSLPAFALFQDAPGSGDAWPKISAGEIIVPVCFRARDVTYEYPKPDSGLSDFPVYPADRWQEKRALVIDAVQDTWQKWTDLRFDG